MVETMASGDGDGGGSSSDAMLLAQTKSEEEIIQSSVVDELPAGLSPQQLPPHQDQREAADAVAVVEQPTSEDNRLNILETVETTVVGVDEMDLGLDHRDAMDEDPLENKGLNNVSSGQQLEPLQPEMKSGNGLDEVTSEVEGEPIQQRREDVEVKIVDQNPIEDDVLVKGSPERNSSKEATTLQSTINTESIEEPEEEEQPVATGIQKAGEEGGKEEKREDDPRIEEEQNDNNNNKDESNTKTKKKKKEELNWLLRQDPSLDGDYWKIDPKSPRWQVSYIDTSSDAVDLYPEANSNLI